MKLSLFVLLLLSSTPAVLLSAQAIITPEASLARVLQQSPAQRDWFAATFLAQIPTAQIDQIVSQYKSQLGAFQRVAPSPDGYTVTMDNGTFPAKIVLDSEARISGLWFGMPEPVQATSLDETTQQFAKLPGKVSLLVLEDGKPLTSLHPGDPLAVGSAFKLAVLAALAQQVSAGKHHWDEVVLLRASWKSLPSGVLLNWPDETPITLATLANQMISISDNTAADALLSIAGREEVEKLAPRNKPFLSTREAFVLKAPSNAALLARYRGANEAGRRALLPELDQQPLPEATQFAAIPLAPDIEWFFTANELCALITQVATQPAMRIKPGLAKPSDWQQVAFKGGSEGGVLNLTTASTDKNGKRYCTVATWNDITALDETHFLTLYSGLLSTLAKQSAK